MSTPSENRATALSILAGGRFAMTAGAAEIIEIIDNLANTHVPERPDMMWAPAFVEFAEIIAANRRFLGEYQFRVLITVGELMLPFALFEANAGTASTALLDRLRGGAS